MPARTFSTVETQRVRTDPLLFTVEGIHRRREVTPPAEGSEPDPAAPARYQTVEDKFAQTFECWDDVPSGVLMDFLAAGEDDALTAEAILAFLDASVVSEQVDAFRELIRDPERIVPLETLGNIAEWLAEEYNDEDTSGRPTPPPANSQRGRRSTNRTSARRR